MSREKDAVVDGMAARIRELEKEHDRANRYARVLELRVQRLVKAGNGLMRALPQGREEVTWWLLSRNYAEQEVGRGD